MTNIIDSIIASLGILVTAIFSCLVWRATKETAKVAKATLKLNEAIAAKEEQRANEYKRIMRRQLLPIIAKESKVAHDAVVDIDPMNIFRKLREAPVSLSVDKHELAKYFSINEVAAIIKAWEAYESYRTNYLKETYSGDEIKILSKKAPKVIDDFYDLNSLLTNIVI